MAVVDKLMGLYTWDRSVFVGSEADVQQDAATRRFYKDKPSLVNTYGADVVNEVENELTAQGAIKAGPIPELIDAKGGTPDVHGFIPGGIYMYKGHKLQYKGNNQWIDVTGGY